MDELRRSYEHPSAEMLYARLKPNYPDLSLGTVYRNLAVFMEDGEVMRIGTVNGQDRFDARTHPHAHFICRVCGCVKDVAEPALSALEQAAAEETGAVIEGHSLTFTGVCAACAANADEGKIGA